MSWIRRRPLLALGTLAFLLRGFCAAVTDYKPIFPAYYYTDANVIHATTVSALDALRAGQKPIFPGTLGERIQTLITLAAYRVFGARPLAIKLVNALLGALAIAALTWTLSLIFHPRVALAAGSLVAVWPSHVFYTSQNLKEAPTNLIAFLALGTALAAAAPPRGKFRSAAFAASATCFLLGTGLYRSYVLACLSGALLLVFAAMTLTRPQRIGGFIGAGAVCLALLSYPRVSRWAFVSFEAKGGVSHDSPELNPNLDRALSRMIPLTYDEFDPGKIRRPTSPEGITAFRKSRQFADRRWAKSQSGNDREIGTQLYPDAEFKSWGNVLAYLPKGGFTVLFMPLPWLYPMDGKIGRWAASGENLILLALTVLAGVGFIRGSKTPARLGLIAFFATMTIGASLLEFDLGSAGRHKLLYLPMLFPFAAEEFFRQLGCKGVA